MRQANAVLLWLAVGLCLAVSVGGSRPTAAAPQDPAELKRCLAVIVNKSNPVENVSWAELRKIFQAERNHWPDGRRITIALREPGQMERAAVLRQIYQMNERDFNRYFLQATFTGEALSAPKTLATASGVRKFVFNVPGAIGCVCADEVDETVKVIRVDGRLPGEKGYRLRLEGPEAGR